MPITTSASGHSGSVLSGVRIASRHSMVSSGFRIGLPASANPLRRIHWISPTQTETRASSAAYGLTSIPLTLAGPTSGKRPLEAQGLRLELHPVLEVLERLQREVEEVPEPHAGSSTVNPRSRSRNARYRRTASFRRFVRVAGVLAASARSSSAATAAFSRCHSASSGRITTGSTSSMIFSRSV